MKVFMSWSGARSKAAAELLHDWIKCVVQASKPWISTRGIGRGTVWFTEINNELKDTSVGIICLTHENKNSPWILFEAGALAKGLTTTRVCTFLVDLGPNDIQDPLAQFNHTLPTRDGLWSLVRTLNSTLESMLDGPTLEVVFEQFWPDFEKKFAALLADHPQVGVVEVRSKDDLLSEILENTRGLNQRIRALEASVERVPIWQNTAPPLTKLGVKQMEWAIRAMADKGINPNAITESLHEQGLADGGIPQFLRQ